MITICDSHNVKISSIIRSFYHLAHILPKYNKFRVIIFFDDCRKKVITCNSYVLYSSLQKYDECKIYVFGISDELESLIIYQNKSLVIIFD